MLIARTIGLLALIASALAAQALAKEGRLGNHFSFRYPESWEFSSGSLQPPPAEPDSQTIERNNSVSTGTVSISLHFSSSMRNEADPAEVAALALGSLAGAAALRPERIALGEQGGWVHSLRTPSGGRLRAYALRLRNGGVAVATLAGTDRLVNSSRPTLEAILHSIRPLDPAAAKDAPPDAAPPAPEPPPVPVVPARTLPPAEEAKLIEHWNATLSGHTWTAGRKLWKLSPDGSYEFESVITIAGLDESNARRSASSGRWRITVRDAEPWLELRPGTGEPMFIACSQSAGAILIDGEAARRQ
ncbi:MAG: hypothetical protein J0L64_18235 [Acidobacteria bacterium]|nr:hypothetical protein [Acidobacteriota bacterium]